jgi:hypothetical protein
MDDVDIAKASKFMTPTTVYTHTHGYHQTTYLYTSGDINAATRYIFQPPPWLNHHHLVFSFSSSASEVLPPLLDLSEPRINFHTFSFM